MKQPLQIDPLLGGVILIDKPLNWTSFDVVKKVRSALQRFGGKKIKVGHAGTLDPLATGLLVLCAGKETKKIELYQAAQKIYSGTIVLGATTQTLDLETQPVDFITTEHLTAVEVLASAKTFEGEILQTPPPFSAVKVDGKRAYELARKGKEVHIEPKKIYIQSFDLPRIEIPEVDFILKCSKGTYVRSLARDLGNQLKVGGYLSALRREAIGDFSVKDAYSIDEFLSVCEDWGPKFQEEVARLSLS